MSRALDQLLSILDLEPLEKNLFRGLSPQVGWQRVFGGQVIGQALVAANRTVEGRMAHSLHAYFLRAGDPAVPIIYEVDRIRDGGSFSTRRVVAVQHGHAIFSMAASFHKEEPGLHHQMKMPDVPAPEGLEQIHAPGSQGQQTEIRQVSGEWGSGDTRGRLWAREANGRPLDHLQLAYLADQYAPRSFFWGEGMRPSATITLSVYVHATAEELAAVGTDFVLNDATGTRGVESTSGQQARLWSRDGVLLATTEQLCWYR